MKKLGLIIGVSIFAVLPIVFYYTTIHYLLLPPITLEGERMALALGLTSAPFCIIAASYITLVWKSQEELRTNDRSQEIIRRID